MDPKQAKSTSSGFTLIEVIVVLVLIGIITVWVFSRYIETNSLSLTPKAETLISHMRYAQARAMGSTTTWGIRYDASAGAGRYWLFRGSTEDRLPLPGEAGDSVDLDNTGFSVSEGSFTLSFDGWGRPTCSGCSSAGVRTYSLTLAIPDSSTGSLTIFQNTGFIEWH